MADNFIRIPPDSTGKRLGTKQHTIDALAVDIQVMHVVSPTEPENIQEIDNQGSAYVRFGDGQPVFDPFNNFKTSSDNIIGVYDFSVNGCDELFTDTTSGAGTIEYNTTESAVYLSATNANGDGATRITDRYHFHQPGTSLHGTLTVKLNNNGMAGCVRNYGYFDDENGLFFRLNGLMPEIVYRTSISGTTVDTVANFTQWNGDGLNGYGKSGIVLNMMEYNTCWFTLGDRAGSVLSLGIYHNGQRITVHTFNTTVNPLKNSSLPIKVEISNETMTAGPNEIVLTNSIIKLTGAPDYTFWRFADMECTDKEVDVDTPLILMRSKKLLSNGQVNHIGAYPETLSIYTDAPVKLQVISTISSDVSGATWNIVGQSTIEGDYAATGIDTTSADYWVMNTYYCQTGCTNIDISKQFELNDYGLCTNAYGDNINITGLVGTALTDASTNVTVTLSYRELW